MALICGHPLELLRERLTTARDLDGIGNGEQVSHCSIVTLRQQPESAKGTIFLALEETGVVQVIVWKSLRDVQRQAWLAARPMVVDGTWQLEVTNLMARGQRI